MAKVRAPLLSIEAHGALDESIIYQTIKGQPIAKAYAKPTYSGSVAQEAWRDEFRMLSTFWRQRLSTAQMTEAYRNYASETNRLGSMYTEAMKLMRFSLETTTDRSMCWKVEHHAGIPSTVYFYFANVETTDPLTSSSTYHLWLTKDLDNWGTPDAAGVTPSGWAQRTYPYAGSGIWYGKVTYWNHSDWLICPTTQFVRP